MPTPPPLERELGLGAYLTDTPGIGGALRTEPEDFQVIELGPGPKPGDGPFTAARIRLRNWETNRFAAQAARRLGIKPGQVGFAGMKDKRAVTEQWFTFRCPAARLEALDGLQDVEVLETRRVHKGTYAGAHDGNRFVLRIRDHEAAPGTVEQTIEQIRVAGGVPHYFGPQRFGSGVRPITHKMGAAMVAGDLEEAVRIYCGHPMATERDDTREARRIYEETRDAEAALGAMPPQLDHERAILARLVREPGNWRYALAAMPHNLRTLFIHAHQSYAFNHIITARLQAGLGLSTAHVGDRVMGIDEDGTKTHLVTTDNQERVQQELDAGRATITAVLPGHASPLAEGRPGEVEATTLERLGVQLSDFTVPELPEVASPGRRRGILQPVRDLELTWQGGDPVVAFGLGKGSYATVVLREIMKGPIENY